MSTFNTMTYYEILEVSFDATPSEIRQAYQSVLSIYQDDSLVADSFFNGDEKANIIKRIEEAYSVLSDSNRRFIYNQSIVLPGSEIRLSEQPAEEDKKVAPIFESPDKTLDKAGFLKLIQEKAQTASVRNLIEEIHGSSVVNGQQFKQLRMALDISHEKIFELTRIGVSVLKGIEENELGDLPPNVYLKSFLKTYAEILQLDPEAALQGFMSFMDQERLS